MRKILISGSSGLIGSALIPSLESHGYAVTRLVRGPPQAANEIQWDPTRAIPAHLVSGFEAVIHLSGESVAGRWNDAKKQRIRDSRIVSTSNLAKVLAESERPPQTFMCASAIGYYGSRGNEILGEGDPSGNGFLAEVCREWEAACEPAAQAGIRTVNPRFGIVLSKNGGALKEILLPFRLGLGGRVGSGRQWWSWVHIADVVAAVEHILGVGPTGYHEVVERRASPSGLQLSGPVNIVSPNPVTNSEFTKTLAEVLKRPAILPVPAFALRMAFGEFADEGLLASARAEPQRLRESGFRFQYSDVRSAFTALL